MSSLYPRDPELALEVDEIIEVVASEIVSGAPQHVEPNEKKKLREAWAIGKLKVAMSYLNEKVVAAKGGFLVDGKRTIADLYVYSCIKSFQNGGYDHIPKTYCHTWPALETYEKMIEADVIFGDFKIPNK